MITGKRKKRRNDKEPAGRDRNIIYSLVGVQMDSDKVAGVSYRPQGTYDPRIQNILTRS